MNADPLDVLLALPDGPDRIARVITEYVAELRAEVDRWRAEAETLRRELATLKLASETARVVAAARVSVLEAELRTAKENDG